MLCTVAGCDSDAKSKGMCWMHFGRSAGLQVETERLQRCRVWDVRQSRSGRPRSAVLAGGERVAVAPKAAEM